MSAITEIAVPVGIAEDMHVNPLGPLESRRLRRARNAAAMASASQTSPSANPGTDSSPETPAPTNVIFSDELAVARQRKLVETSERVRILSES